MFGNFLTFSNSKLLVVLYRFRHFEELHRRLKEFPEYNLHLPPKHFLSSGLDLLVVQERCKLLDKYVKVNNATPLLLPCICFLCIYLI